MRHMWDIVHDQNPVMLSPSTSIKVACAHMRDRRVGAALVVDDTGHLLGIFTGRDAITRVLAEGRDSSTTLNNAMTPEPDTIGPEKSAVDALRQMQDGGFRHLPVVDNGRVVGIVSRGDFRGVEIDRLDEETAFSERIW